MPNDFYPTPKSGTEILLRHFNPKGLILEPCSGLGAISDLLLDRGFQVITNDIELEFPSTYHYDVLSKNFITWAANQFDWIITNPPFSLAPKMLPSFYDLASKGIAMMLRLSWLEPTNDRFRFLKEHPPTHQIVMPRLSFTGDRKTDNVATAWFI